MNKEVELAKMVVDGLIDDGFDVYQEVELPIGRADIVAKRDHLIWIVETKLTMSLDLIEQAYERVRYAHLVSVAIPYSKQSRHFARRLLAAQGIGLLQISQVGGWDFHRINWEPPLLHRKADTSWTKNLCEEQKTCSQAGSKAGGYWTRFRATCRAAARYVSEHPGCTARELIDGIDHHYYSDSTARSSLIKRIEQGLVAGVMLKRDGKRWRIYPKEAENG